MAHWRDTGRRPRFGPIDYRAALPLLLFLMHIEVWTFLVAVGACLLFFFVERFGIAFGDVFLLVRLTLGGKTKRAVSWWRYQANVDFMHRQK